MTRRTGGALFLMLAAWLAAADAQEQDPPICAAALAGKPGDELAALARAEADRWRVARRAAQDGRKAMRSTLGASNSGGSQGFMRAFDVAAARRTQAVAEARILCECRERRGDPDREDCHRLYLRH